jgi:hypothetical protein
MQDYREQQRGMAGSAFEDNLDSEPLPKLDDLDPIATALENLRQIRAALKGCQPAAVAGLTKREGELTAWLVKERDKMAAGKQKSALDQLAERRANRAS